MPDMYIDSNILIFAILDEGRLGADANTFLRRIREGEIKASISPLVLDEVMWALQKTIGREETDLAIEGILGLPLTWLDIGFSCIQHARRHFIEGLDPRDAFHVAIMNDYDVNLIVSEDIHFDKIKEIKRKGISEAIKV